jgi:hypothetical protein
MTYRVVWEIDVEARTPREAAKKALAIQRKPDSAALVFEVAAYGVTTLEAREAIDLQQGSNRKKRR